MHPQDDAQVPSGAELTLEDISWAEAIEQQAFARLSQSLASVKRKHSELAVVDEETEQDLDLAAVLVASTEVDVAVPHAPPAAATTTAAPPAEEVDDQAVPDHGFITIDGVTMMPVAAPAEQRPAVAAQPPASEAPLIGPMLSDRAMALNFHYPDQTDADVEAPRSYGSYQSPPRKPQVVLHGTVQQLRSETHAECPPKPRKKPRTHAFLRRPSTLRIGLARTSGARAGAGPGVRAGFKAPRRVDYGEVAAPARPRGAAAGDGHDDDAIAFMLLDQSMVPGVGRGAPPRF